MIWPISLVRAIADFKKDFAINVDDLVDMTEGVALDYVLDLFLDELKKQFPEAGPVTRKHLEMNTTRDIDYNRISVVVRWNSRDVGQVYIPSEDRLFVPSWKVGPSSPRFRLPVEPEMSAYSIWADPTKSIIKPGHKDLELLGYDPERNAWVYEVVGITTEEIRGTRPLSIGSFPRLAGKTRMLDELREELGLPRMSEHKLEPITSSRLNEHMKHVHIPIRIENDNMRYEWRPEEYRGNGTKLTKAKPLKDQPVRESGLGIW